MSRRHLDMIAHLPHCGEADSWLLALPDAMTPAVAFGRAPKHWKWWLREHVPTEPAMDADKRLLLAMQPSPTEEQAFWLSIRAGLRCMAAGPGGPPKEDRAERRLVRKGHPADAWTVPALLAIPPGGA